MRKGRSCWLLAAAFLGNELSAQLFNPSFEDANGGSIEGWFLNPPDSEYMLFHEGAPGYGDWSIAVHSSINGIWLNGVYQALPFLEPGDVVTLSAWVKCPLQYWMCGTVVLDAGYDQYVQSSEPDWTFFSVTDTVEGSVPGGYTVNLSTRSVGNGSNSNPYPAYIDGVAVEKVGHVGVDELQTDQLRILVDKDQVRILGSALIEDCRLVDLSGRTTLITIVRNDAQELSFPVQDLASGIYVLVARSAGMTRTARFALQ